MNPILIFQTAFLGDLLLAIPLVKRIKKKFPTHSLQLASRHGFGQIFKEVGLVDQVIDIRKSPSTTYKDQLRSLKKENYDFIFCPHYSIRTNLLMMSLNSAMKVGFGNFWNYGVFHKRISRNMRLPDALRQLQLISPWDPEVLRGLEIYDKERPNILDLSELPPLNGRLSVPNFSSMSLKKEIQGHPNYTAILNKYSQAAGAVFMAPGSVWKTKRWKKEKYRELAKKFPKVVLVGSPQERPLCEEIAQGLDHIINLAGEPSLFELFFLLTQASLLVCNDSGSMHMGSAAETPTVAIFGPTILEFGFQPWQDQALVVENKNLPGRPCGIHGGETCKKGHKDCMEGVEVENVYRACQKLLER